MWVHFQDNMLCMEREDDMFQSSLDQLLCTLPRPSAVRCFTSLLVLFDLWITFFKVSVTLIMFQGKVDFLQINPFLCLMYVLSLSWGWQLQSESWIWWEQWGQSWNADTMDSMSPHFPGTLEGHSPLIKSATSKETETSHEVRALDMCLNIWDHFTS
jgi:hypothetical protein